MTVQYILTPIINQEFEKYARSGRPIKLKTISKKRTKYSIICSIIALCGFAHPVFFLVIPIYIVLMCKAGNKVNTILSLARKSPDKPIAQIIAEEITV